MCALDMVKMLLENEDMRSEVSFLLLQYWIYLLVLQVDAVDDDNRTALMLVAMHDRVDTKIAELLCKAGANVNYDGDSVSIFPFFNSTCTKMFAESEHVDRSNCTAFRSQIW